MLEIKNKNGESVVRIEESGGVTILSEELYLNGKVSLKEDAEDKEETDSENKAEEDEG